MRKPSIEERLFPGQILCALDLPGRAGNAVQAAVWLAETLAAPLEIVHAFPKRPILWGKEEDMPEWVAGREATGRALRESLREILAAAPPGLPLRTSASDLRFHVRVGHPVQVILEQAQAVDADLIVLGPHAERRWFDVGSTARGVLAHAPDGVWVQPGAARPIRRILAPIDLSVGSLHALERARDLARRLGAHVTAFLSFVSPDFGGLAPENLRVVGPTYVLEHLRRDERSRFEAAVAAFDWRGVPHEARFEEGDPVKAILAAQSDCDLIVMGTHGRTGLSAALLGAVTHGVVRASDTPVLALRQPQSSYALG